MCRRPVCSKTSRRFGLRREVVEPELEKRLPTIPDGSSENKGLGFRYTLEGPSLSAFSREYRRMFGVPRSVRATVLERNPFEHGRWHQMGEAISRLVALPAEWGEAKE
jgi:hypothetical protein